jgi:hypothetical protein
LKQEYLFSAFALLNTIVNIDRDIANIFANIGNNIALYCTIEVQHPDFNLNNFVNIDYMIV